MKKVSVIFIVWMICLFLILPNPAQAGPEFSFFWVRVLNSYGTSVNNALVIARNNRNGTQYPMFFRGWGYYNRSLPSGYYYDIIVNGRVLKWGVYASPYWYVIITCRI